MNITKLALRRPVSTLLILLALGVFGITSIFGFKLELQPEMELPMLMVMTIYPGADPQSIEELVTKEVESAGSVLSGVETVNAISQENYSVVLFSYEYGTDLKNAYTDLRAALDTARSNMPKDAQTPTVIELSMTDTDTVTVSASNIADADLLAYIKNDVEPELRKLSAVADVSISGGKENYYKVSLNEEMLKQYGLTMSSIAQFIAAVDFSMPAGTVSAGSQDISIASGAKTKTVAALSRVPIVTSTGAVITVGDVANVTESVRDAESISRYNGSENITIGVIKKRSKGTVNAADSIKKVINRLNASNDAVELRIVYDASEMIINSLLTVGKTLIIGIVLSMVILLLFFGDIRASLIVGSAMPISLFATLIAMSAMGFSLNLVTTGALVIAIGMMVDNSIVVVESCFRLREELGGDDSEDSFKEAALKGTSVITGAIIASTITTVVVYVPLSIMKGLAGQIFSELGFTIIFAMLASLISALTLIPLFFCKFKPREKTQMPINKVISVIKVQYEKILRKILFRKKTAVAVAVLLLALSFVMVYFTNMELIPNISDGSLAVQATFRSGTKLSVIDEKIAFIEEAIANDPDVDFYNLTIRDNSANITAYLNKGVKPAETSDLWNEKFADVTGMDLTVSVGGAAMSDMMNTGMEIDMIGHDREELKKAASDIETIMRQTQGVIKVNSDIGVAATKIDVTVDPLKAMNVGLTPVQVALAINQTLSGVEAVRIKNLGEERSVRLEYPDNKYNDINELMNLYIPTPYGTQIALGDIAEFEYTDAPETLRRVDGLYQVAITAYTTQDGRFTAQKAINEQVDKLELPDGVMRASSLQDQMMNEEFGAILRAIAVAIFLVFLVMAMQFESPRFSGMVMMSIPFSLIGSFFLLFITRSTLSMVSLMGLLMLMGIVVNNGILYIETVHMLKETMPVEEALIKSGQLRLRPILMTTLTTIISMIPMGLGVGQNGALMQGMALVIIGGLIASTILILILMPSFYLIIYRPDKKVKVKNKKEE